MSLVVLFMAANVLRYGAIDESMTTFAKAFKMSFIPYFYMFLLGVLGQQNVDRLLPVLRGKVVLWAGGYVAISYLTGATGMHSLNNAVNPLNVILMAGLALSAAFSWPSLGDRILHRNDISYGVYIFHMPIANLLIYESIGGLWTRYAIFIVSTIVAATLSWRLVERHALRLKVDALRPVRERPLVGLQT
jgi:peptidoglycan/LPS O-acetylase OafA/YrhL